MRHMVYKRQETDGRDQRAPKTANFPLAGINEYYANGKKQEGKSRVVLNGDKIRTDLNERDFFKMPAGNRDKPQHQQQKGAGYLHCF